ncbi:hypothetical protein SODALDRAFT_266709 [Sodiomyces alkalinus F11]|uniref:Uncharacterized protein n=1 Tax=Sodiomyces alkalinus (strain CBS 110278 / VKM F-3762 / F11) TaxID=1314773 RepID=A0A3N2Q5P6_SODAK|nr:hypothetical protein SODALDRAFT_266709 [Sodiomyces alkalinus F11]ROT42103.1 hypothetical protein SODALDRAFT_266709 [Sodiomyces alkalinus F11]
MLDENLPSFHFKPSSDSPLHTILFFTHNGSELSPYYLLMRPDPALPASKDKYAVALTDVSSQSIIYAETLVEPSWTQPTLSTAEIRAQNHNGNGAPLPATPITPDAVTLALYNPDSQVVIRTKPGSWGKSDSWEFELPEESFRAPSASMIDRTAGQPPVSDVIPKIVFRWKKESRISKEMTCYMVGKSVDGKKSKEPDITVAMFKVGRHGSTVAIYEPNLRRVEVEDRKGLELVLLLSAEVICDLYLNPKTDPFNAAGRGAVSSGRIKDGRGATGSPAAAAAPPGKAVAATTAATAAAAASTTRPGPSNPRRQEEIDMETRRLQAMVEEEERLARKQERRDEEEARRIRDMLNREEEERRRGQAEVERETERLRRQYGVQGQAYGGGGGGGGGGGPAQANPAASPPLPPRPSPNPGGFSPGMSPTTLQTPLLPQRPLSTGPMHMSGGTSWWGRPAGAPSSGAAGNGGSRPGKKHTNPLSGLFSRDRDRERDRERGRGTDGPGLLRKKSL